METAEFQVLPQKVFNGAFRLIGERTVMIENMSPNYYLIE